ncbi:TetR family transcriptional regulator [Tamaricihabitans halophyticus]|uniref:TetR family transcriptional regulator n=1 Tax=Tamaricihabitans halophyticus TaxID=1262583 RepID=A0A4R2QKJ1_9PSEU|nr:TetR/AcrR family transcriptional regulator [Tamaricihabitans halophyticus]TCP49953.1 TetR family transcriptional regulator [Tamaricihabitans halophyticus]
MPPKFTEAERVRITDALRAAGYELFTTQGIRKTSIDELVSSAGIAKSSFYVFFESKEHLYLELMIRQAPEIGRKLLPAAQEAPDARTGLVNLFTRSWELTDADPLYRRLIKHPEDLKLVHRRVMTDEEIARVHPHIMRPMIEFIEHWQDEGQLVAADPRVVLGVFRAASLIAQHADEFGELYPQVAELLKHAVAAGLTVAQAEGENQS